MNPLFSETDTLTQAMLEGIKDAVKSELKKKMFIEMDTMLEDIAKDIVLRLHGSMSDRIDILGEHRTLNVELLFANTKGEEKRYKTKSETSIVEMI
jgi:hypothetical protein